MIPEYASVFAPVRVREAFKVHVPTPGNNAFLEEKRMPLSRHLR